MTFMFIFAVWISLNLLAFTRRIVLPYIAERLAEKRWQSLHPGMSVSRRRI